MKHLMARSVAFSLYHTCQISDCTCVVQLSNQLLWCIYMWFTCTRHTHTHTRHAQGRIIPATHSRTKINPAEDNCKKHWDLSKPDQAPSIKPHIKDTIMLHTAALLVQVHVWVVLAY